MSEIARRLRVGAGYSVPELVGMEGEAIRRVKGTEIYIARMDGLAHGHGPDRNEWALTRADFDWLDQ